MRCLQEPAWHTCTQLEHQRQGPEAHAVFGLSFSLCHLYSEILNTFWGRTCNIILYSYLANYIVSSKDTKCEMWVLDQSWHRFQWVTTLFFPLNAQFWDNWLTVVAYHQIPCLEWWKQNIGIGFPTFTVLLFWPHSPGMESLLKTHTSFGTDFGFWKEPQIKQHFSSIFFVPPV